MDAMFYSLKEVAEKLNKTQEEVKEIVKQGRLREFRVGSNVLFKIDEVEALMSDTSIMASEEPSAPVEQAIEQDEISLAPEPTEVPIVESESTEADTAITSEGIDVLEETSSREQEITDDTVIETKGTTGEALLEEIEEDVSLDASGSGSGLLDLSLQADDTSLGGILDEIYTPEGVEGEEIPEVGSAVEMAAEAEQMLPEEELAAAQPVPEAPALAHAYIEPEPDVQSNTFGILLFLPLLAIVYTAIVAIAEFNDAVPSAREKIQGAIWYIVIGAVAAAGLVIGTAFMLSRDVTKAGKKPKKPKKAKKTPPLAPEEATA